MRASDYYRLRSKGMTPYQYSLLRLVSASTLAIAIKHELGLL